ncbi:MAG: O-antigen ligase family protein [Microbacterium sp.]|nr:O-antigen ligase family protein [Microbacterium sp.]
MGATTLLTPRARLLLTHGAAVIAFAGGVYATALGDDMRTGPVLILLGTAVPLLVVAQPWRFPWWLLTLAVALPVGVAIVAITHGDAHGIGRMGKFAYFGALLLGVSGWARTPTRRVVLAGAILLLGVLQFLWSMEQWLAGHDIRISVYGLIGWHNQLADFELVPWALGLCLVALGVSALRARSAVRTAVLLIVAASAGAAGAAILLSGSRFGLGLAACALAAALLLTFLAHRGRALIPTLAWIALTTAIAFGLMVLMRSELFFPTEAAEQFDQATAIRALDRGLSTDDNSFRTRLEMWGAALRMGATSPAAGVGLLRFIEFERCLVAEGTGLFWHPHNEWLYAWAEGGLSLLLPLLALTAGLIVLGVRSLRPFPGAPQLRADPARWGALVGLGAIAAAQMLEYDLAYPVLLALIAGTAGMCASPLIAAMRAPGAHASLASRVLAGMFALVVVGGAIALLIDPTLGEAPWLYWYHHPIADVC